VFLAVAQVEGARALLFVLSAVLEQVKVDDEAAFGSVKVIVVEGLKELLGVASSSSPFDTKSLTTVRQGMLSVLKVALDAGSNVDMGLVAEIASGWVDLLKKVVAGETGQVADAEYAGEWVEYVQPGEILDLLSGIVQSPEVLSNTIASRAIFASLRALRDASSTNEHQEFLRRLSRSLESMSLLFRLHSLLLQVCKNPTRSETEEETQEKLKGVKVVEELIATLLESEGIPVGLSGEQFASLPSSHKSWAEAVEDAEGRWSGRSGPGTYPTRGGVTGDAIKSFLARPLQHWTDATEKIVGSFLYKHPSDVGAFLREVAKWAVDAVARADDIGGRQSLIGVVHALLDCALHRQDTSSSGLLDKTKLGKLLLQEVIRGGERRAQARAALQFFVELSIRDEAQTEVAFSMLEQDLKALRKSITSTSSSTAILTPQLIHFARWLNGPVPNSKKISGHAKSIGNEVVELAMQWLIRKLGDQDGQRELGEETSAVCAASTALIKMTSMALKATTLETLLGVIVQSQYHVAQPECLEVLDVALRDTSLKVAFIFSKFDVAI
jgi:hypothetical protein